MSDSELLVSVSMRFPTLDRTAIAEHLAPLLQASVAAGGFSTHISVQPWDPDDEESDA